MLKVSFNEYQDAKYEIIGGVEYQEETQFPNQWGMSSKQYSTAENGTFYEVTDPKTGFTEFWSDNHPDSRYYDGRTCSDIAVNREAAPPTDAAPDVETILDKLTVDLIMTAGRVNDYVEQNDSNRNHTNYGIVTKCADVLRLLRIDTNVPCWEDNGFLKIPCVTIGAKTVYYHNGQAHDKP